MNAKVELVNLRKEFDANELKPKAETGNGQDQGSRDRDH